MTSLPTHPHPELSAEARAALVIATGRYSDTALAQLDAVARDAAEMGKVLADPDIGAFDVTLVVDGCLQEIRLAVQGFLKERHRDDTIVVYLSCHGLLDEEQDELYFAATDTRMDLLAASGLEAKWLSARLAECRAAKQVVILDCCNSGAFGRAAGNKGKGDADLRLKDRFILEDPEARGRYVLTASRANQPSWVGDRVAGVSTGSVFTSALVEGLQTGAADADADGYISVDEAYTYAYEKVKASRADQVPQRWISAGEGKLFLARNPVGVPTVAAALSEEAQARPPTSNFDLEILVNQRWFVDRKDELDACGRELSECPFLIVHGLDGYGKTTLAKVYAAKKKNDYDIVWLVSASHESEVSAALERLAEELRPSDAPERDLRERLNAVRGELTTRNRWLLIFDDVLDWESIRDYIPPLRGHIIVTTQFVDWTPNVRNPIPRFLHLRELPRAASKKYLMDQIKGATDSAADRLADNLGDLPYALELAVRELATKGGIPEVYNYVYDNNEALRALWQGTIDQLKKSPLAHSLLEFCSFFASAPIPDAVLALPSGKPGPTDELRAALAHPATYADLVETLRRSSLLDAPPGSGMITVHRLLQTYLLENMPRERRHKLLSVAIGLLLDAFYQSWFYIDRCAQALPHAEACLKIAVHDEIAPRDTSILMTRMAHYHRTRGDIFKACDLHEQALRVREKAFGENSPEVARSLINLGLVLIGTGEPDKAVETQKRALGILTSVEPPDEELAAGCRNNLGMALTASGQYAQAIKWHKQAYDFWNKENELHSNAAQALDNIGRALYLLGDLAQAEKMLQRAVKIAQKALDTGFDKLDLAEMLHNQGQILRAQAGVYEAWRAVPILDEALTLRSKELGDQHVTVIRTRTELVRVLRCLGEHARAAEEARKVRRAIRDLQRSDNLWPGPTGSPDPDSSRLRAILIAEGELQFAQGKYAGARQRLEQAKKLADRSVPPMPRVEYAELIENLGKVCNAQSPHSGEYWLKEAARKRVKEAAEKQAELNEARAAVSLILAEADQ
jgi:tetratricopeptide (TPR) repeat protein